MPTPRRAGPPSPSAPRIRTGALALLLSAGLLPLGGCYTFRPATADQATVGEDIRVRVSGEFSDSVAPLLGMDFVRVLEGEVVTDDSESLMLQVPVSSEFAGMRLETLSQRIQIPDAALVDVEIRELSRPRTFGALAVVAGAAAAIVITQFSGDSGGAQLPGPGRPVEEPVARPWFSIPVNLFSSLFGG